jgi:hypothetical protein
MDKNEFTDYLIHKYFGKTDDYDTILSVMDAVWGMGVCASTLISILTTVDVRITCPDRSIQTTINGILMKLSANHHQFKSRCDKLVESIKIKEAEEAATAIKDSNVANNWDDVQDQLSRLLNPQGEGEIP